MILYSPNQAWGFMTQKLKDRFRQWKIPSRATKSVDRGRAFGTAGEGVGSRHVVRLVRREETKNDFSAAGHQTQQSLELRFGSELFSTDSK